MKNIEKENYEQEEDEEEEEGGKNYNKEMHM